MVTNELGSLQISLHLLMNSASLASSPAVLVCTVNEGGEGRLEGGSQLPGFGPRGPPSSVRGRCGLRAEALQSLKVLFPALAAASYEPHEQMRDEQSDLEHELGRKDVPDHEMPPQDEYTAARRCNEEKPPSQCVLVR